MHKEIVIECKAPKAWGMVTSRFTLCGVECVDTFARDRLADYGADARIVEVKDDPQATMWARAYEQDKLYRYNG